MTTRPYKKFERMKTKTIYIFLITLVITFNSCENYLDVKPTGNVLSEKNYTTKDDAISAINGLYGLMQDLVDPIWLMGETQGDLVVPARGADRYLYDICTHQATPDNPYTDYTKFYRLVNACNSAIEGLQHLNSVNQDYTSDLMAIDLAEVKVIRGWTYFQMVKIWGDVPYMDKFIQDIDQIKDVPATSGDSILKKVAIDLEGAVTKGLFVTPTNANVTDAYRFNYYSIRYMMAEIYVNLGQYLKAREALGTYIPVNPINSQYYRMDTYAKADWITQFSVNTYTGTQLKSWLQYINFDDVRNQKHSLLKWTNNQGNGIYAFKPSTNAIQNWNSQQGALDALTSTNQVVPSGTQGDVWRGNYRSYLIDGKDTLIFKYLIKDNTVLGSRKDPYADDMPFILGRDAHAALLMAEILNRLGHSEEALLYINGSNTAYAGVRFRVRLMPTLITNRNENITEQVDNIILDEWALETAFEGSRWFDLVRMAKSKHDPSVLANRVAMKYPAAQQEAIKQRLMNPDYWYLPYNQRNVDANKLLKQRPY